MKYLVIASILSFGCTPGKYSKQEMKDLGCDISKVSNEAKVQKPYPTLEAGQYYYNIETMGFDIMLSGYQSLIKKIDASLEKLAKDNTVAEADKNIKRMQYSLIKIEVYQKMQPIIQEKEEFLGEYHSVLLIRDIDGVRP